MEGQERKPLRREIRYWGHVNWLAGVLSISRVPYQWLEANEALPPWNTYKIWNAGVGGWFGDPEKHPLRSTQQLPSFHAYPSMTKVGIIHIVLFESDKRGKPCKPFGGVQTSHQKKEKAFSSEAKRGLKTNKSVIESCKIPQHWKRTNKIKKSV